MLYKFKKEKTDEFRGIATNRGIAGIVGCTENYLGLIFAGKTNVSKPLVLSLICLKYNFNLGNNKLEDLIKYYFEESD